MCKIFIAFFSGFTFLVLPLVSLAQVGPFDVAINNGRVIDPQSGLDASRHIGIIAGRIVAISETARSSGISSMYLNIREILWLCL